MGLLNTIKNAFKSKRVDLDKRFYFSKKWIQGSFGRFHIVKEKSDGKKYGLKILDPAKTKQFRDKFDGKGFPSESEIANTLRHSAIVETVETGFTSKGNEFLLMEFMDGPLLDYAIEQRDQIVRKNALKITKQLASAIQFVHESDYIHRDICPRNILLNRSGEQAKLFDFSLSVPNRPEFRQPKNRTGTPLYMAPEIVRRRATDHTVDIFAFGITVYQLMTFEHPWGVTENTSKSALLFDSRPATNIRDHVPKIQDRIADAIMSCLEFDPAKRCPSIKRFLMTMGIK